MIALDTALRPYHPSHVLSNARKNDSRLFWVSSGRSHLSRLRRWLCLRMIDLYAPEDCPVYSPSACIRCLLTAARPWRFASLVSIEFIRTMAEVIGVVASVSTLIKGAAFLAGATRELAKKFQDAPEELRAIAAQLLILKKDLEQIKRMEDEALTVLLADDVREEINSALRQARDAVAKIDSICVNALGNIRFKARARWINKDHKLVEELLSRPRLARDRMMFLLQILSWSVQQPVALNLY